VSDLCKEGQHIRPVRPEDGPSVVHFLNQVFGAWGSLDDWQWKHQAPPAPFRLDSVLAERDGRIVGHYGLLPVEARWGGQVVRAAQAVDAGVLPAYRHRGMFTALAREALGRAIDAGVTLIYAFPGLLSLDVNLQLGYRSVAFVPEMVRVLSLRRALALALSRLPGDLGTLWAMRRQAAWTPTAVARVTRLRRALLLAASWASTPHLAAPRGPGQPRCDRLVLRALDGFDARFDALWASTGDTIGLGLCKNARYLAWRYRARASCLYPVIVAEEGDQLLGCVVMRHAGLRSQIADLLAVPQRTDVVSGLLSAAIARARNAGSILLSAWAPAWEPHHASLRRAGFVSSWRLHELAERRPALARFFYQVIAYTKHLSPERQAQLAVQVKAWSLSMGDSDLV